ncbi:chloramphenicol acetyltransferase [Thalassospira sp. MCCC 1A02491]|uniref:chloramphenicol acetyltransferase n=1 Tax=Thalassospira sp. MCCC 1A02491 TaxID=1769751 RepID=UPI0007AD752D|nr:chloramphenicol acetyltransferase [Thalassospira sp. MCCC 1A02491]KZB59173.1 chloramphenicol acetyltransferase [Thalassospira sp. MCCC 1A02491]
MTFQITQVKPAMKALSEYPTIDATATVVDCEMGVWTEVGPRTSMRETKMGDYSYVVNDSEIIYSDIGKFVNIAAHTRINPGQHPMDRASMHHFQYRSSAYELGDDDPAFFDWRREKRVTLHHDVWIGHGAIVQGGVTIGIGSVVGSGAVVTKDVPPYTIVTGIPASPLRPRFEADIIDALLRIQWWDWSHDMLRERLVDFRSLPVRDFCLKYDTV